MDAYEEAVEAIKKVWEEAVEAVEAIKKVWEEAVDDEQANDDLNGLIDEIQLIQATLVLD